MSPPITPNDLPLRIGADSNGASRFVGDIARAQLFGRALSANEVAALAQGKPVQPPAPIGDWTFAQAKDGAFPNAVGEGLAAKIVGEVAVVASPHGKAVRLTGKGYLEVADDPGLDLTMACTLAAWVCPKALPAGGGRILDKTTVGASDGYLLDTCPGNSLRLICERGALGSGTQLVPARWAHVAATVDADGSMALYVNGKRVADDKRSLPAALAGLHERIARMRKFHGGLVTAGLGTRYEAEHTRLAVEYFDTFHRRLALLADGKLKPLAPRSQHAADQSYITTTANLCAGLEQAIRSYEKSDDPHKKRIYQLWSQKP
ncbi:hypothetical protein HQ576_10140 [bacterium]|nr:hypothetical protein [bacterium]